MKAEQLRKSILQYAIQGKLVPQIETEEPASELLKKIKAEKQELIKRGAIYKKKKLPPFTDDDKPFEIPDIWEWCYLSDVSIIQEGAGIRRFQYQDNGIQLLSVTNILENSIDLEKKQLYVSNEEYESKYKHLTANKGDIVTACSGGSWGKTAIYDKADIVMLNTSTLRMRFFSDLANNQYLYYLTKSFCFKNQIEKQLSGMQPNFGYAHYSKVLIPLPPLAEQQRIVVRIEELMILVDEYEKREIELSKLEKEFPEKLKKSILQYAIQGKLVPQIDTEEPASELLKKIKAEKQELIRQGKIKKQKDLPAITDEEKPFDIPDSWEWMLVDDIVQKTIKRGKSPKYADKGNTLVFAQKCNTKMNGIEMSLAQYLDESILSKYPQEEFMCNNDIIINSTGHGTMGRVGIFLDFNNIEDYLIVPDSHVTIIRVLSEIYPLYAYYYLKNKQSYFESMGDGSTNQTELKPINIASLYFPLPPLAEQQRIVARIEELFTLVDILAEGKKLPKVTAITENKDNVIPFVTVENDETKHRVDVSSFEMAARDSDSVKPETMEKVLEQVQAYYDKKN